jgi:hypothetical protein
MVVLAAYGQELNNGVWRVSFGIGLVIPVALLFFRLRMLDSEQYAKHAMRDRIPYLLVVKRYWRAIIGTSMAWFMYDFVVSGIINAAPPFSTSINRADPTKTRHRSTHSASSAPPSSPA